MKPLVSRLRSALPTADIVFVDDNSPDGTDDVVHELAATDPRLRVIVRTNERGLGGAILRAVDEALTLDYDFFINLDADLSHDPADLPAMVAKATSDDSIDVVVGSRYVPGGKIVGWPLRRKIMSRIVNRFAIICLRLPVKDCSGSMRCYRVSALKKVDIEQLQCRGYALLEELLVQLKKQGSKMVEVPITFTERQHGMSKLTFGEAMRSVGFMLRLAFRR